MIWLRVSWTCDLPSRGIDLECLVEIFIPKSSPKKPKRTLRTTPNLSFVRTSSLSIFLRHIVTSYPEHPFARRLGLFSRQNSVAGEIKLLSSLRRSISFAHGFCLRVLPRYVTINFHMSVSNSTRFHKKGWNLRFSTVPWTMSCETSIYSGLRNFQARVRLLFNIRCEGCTCHSDK